MVVYSEHAETWGENWKWSTGEDIESEGAKEYDPAEDPRRKEWEIE